MQGISSKDLEIADNKKSWLTLVLDNKVTVILILLGGIFIGIGILLIKGGQFESNTVEVIESDSTDSAGEIVVEVAGAVEKPGVYRFENGARVEDLLISSGGISADADRAWMEKIINRAARLSDGQKIYIKRYDEHSSVLSDKNEGVYQNISTDQGRGDASMVNINAASAKELESLWGIGPVYAQNIIEQRPYSSVEELLTKGVIKKNVYERNKDLMVVY